MISAVFNITAVVFGAVALITYLLLVFVWKKKALTDKTIDADLANLFRSMMVTLASASIPTTIGMSVSILETPGISSTNYVFVFMGTIPPILISLYGLVKLFKGAWSKDERTSNTEKNDTS